MEEGNNKKKIFLIDSYALIYRSFYAFNKQVLVNQKGNNVAAVLGYVTWVMDIIRKERPTHIAAVFDRSEPTFRHQMFNDYKGNRDTTPEEIHKAVPKIQQIIKAMGIVELSYPGYEADDVIGTIAKRAEKEGFTSYMVTSDKDFGQLVSDNIFIYKPGRSGKDVEIMGVEQVLQKFDIDKIDQVVDYLAMVGDLADNIPGLDGVGEVFAKRFLKQYGSIENLINNVNDIKGSLGEKISKSSQMGLKSKILAKIVTDVPLDVEIDSLKRGKADMPVLKEIFQDLGFKRLWAKAINDLSEKNPEKELEEGKNKKLDPQNSDEIDLFSEIKLAQKAEKESLADFSVGYFENIKSMPIKCMLVKTLDQKRELLKELLNAEKFSFFVNSSNKRFIDASVKSIYFSIESKKSYYVQINNNEDLKFFAPVFLSEKLKITYNLKNAVRLFLKNGLEIKSAFDVMLAHYLIDPESQHSMDSLCERYLKYNVISEKEYQVEYSDDEKRALYGCEKSDTILRLYDVLEPLLKQKNQSKLFYEVEMPLVYVLAQMELNGINLDKDFFINLKQNVSQQLKDLEDAIFEEADIVFNLNSPKQIGDILFDRLKIPTKSKKTKTGQWSTSEEILSELQGDNPIIANILKYRTIQKINSTYIDILPNSVSEKTGRIHSTFNQTIVATGRLSSTEPNMQNVPIKTDLGREIRRGFIPQDENYMIMAVDYSQIELRIIAHLANEDNMIEDFANNKDIHLSTASKVFGIPIEEVSKQQRSYAKSVNFGIIYGLSVYGLARQLNVATKKAADMIENYYKTYPKLIDYIEEQKKFASENKYVETIMGRRRYLPEINSLNNILRSAAERNAVNAPVQGSAADIIKKAMVEIDFEIKNRKMQSKMLLQVHDELVFDAYKPEIEELKTIVEDKMINAWGDGKILKVDIGISNNWLEAH